MQKPRLLNPQFAHHLVYLGIAGGMVLGLVGQFQHRWKPERGVTKRTQIIKSLSLVKGLKSSFPDAEDATDLLQSRKVILAGNASKQLAQATRKCLKKDTFEFVSFSGSQHNLGHALRGKTALVVQTLCPPFHDHLLELLQMCAVCKHASVQQIIALIPYLGSAHQEDTHIEPGSMRTIDIASLLEAMGVSHVVTVDLHRPQIQGYFTPRVAVDDLEIHTLGVEYLKTKRLRNVTIATPEQNDLHRASKFLVQWNQLNDRRAHLAVILHAGHSEDTKLIGSIRNCDVVVVQDVFKNSQELGNLSSLLKDNGAKRIFVLVTHGDFDANALEVIERSPIEEVIVTDTVACSPVYKRSTKIHHLSIAPILAHRIERVVQDPTQQKEGF